MKQKFGIRKTKMNIFWLLVVGLLIGLVLGLRQPMNTQPVNGQSSVTQGVKK